MKMLDTIELLAVEMRHTPEDTEWFSQGELATPQEISWYNERHGWSKARPMSGGESP